MVIFTRYLASQLRASSAKRSAGSVLAKASARREGRRRRCSRRRRRRPPRCRSPAARRRRSLDALAGCDGAVGAGVLACTRTCASPRCTARCPSTGGRTSTGGAVATVGSAVLALPTLVARADATDALAVARAATRARRLLGARRAVPADVAPAARRRRVADTDAVPRAARRALGAAVGAAVAAVTHARHRRQPDAAPRLSRHRERRLLLAPAARAAPPLAVFRLAAAVARAVVGATLLAHLARLARVAARAVARRVRLVAERVGVAQPVAEQFEGRYSGVEQSTPPKPPTHTQCPGGSGRSCGTATRPADAADGAGDDVGTGASERRAAPAPVPSIGPWYSRLGLADAASSLASRAAAASAAVGGGAAAAAAARSGGRARRRRRRQGRR